MNRGGLKTPLKDYWDLAPSKMGAIGHAGEQAYRNTKNGHPMLVKKLTDTSLAERLKCSLGAVRSLVTGEVATLRARIESLQAELAKLEATAASHQADFERERDRADRLLTELLKANANATGAMAAKLKGEIAAMRSAAEASTGADVVIARPLLDADTSAAVPCDPSALETGQTSL